MQVVIDLLFMAKILMACRQENVDMKAEPTAVKDGNALACLEPLTNQVEACPRPGRPQRLWILQLQLVHRTSAQSLQFLLECTLNI